MIVINVLPVVLSSLLIAAHFYRSGSVTLAVICAIIPIMLTSKNRWIPRVIIFFLMSAAVEWLRTMYLFMEQYQSAGISSKRLVIILSAVALFTVLSSLIFRTNTMKKRYSGNSKGLRIEILSERKIK